MNTKLISTAAIVLIGICYLLLLSRIEKKEIVLEKDGLKLAKISKEDVVMRAQENYIFLLKDEKRQIKDVYKIVSQHSSHAPSKISHHSVAMDIYSDDDLFLLAMKEKLGIPETLNLNYEELKSLVSQASQVEARELIPIAPQGDWLAVIEESVLIFLFLAFILIIPLAFFELLKSPFNIHHNRKGQRIVDLLLIGGVIAFLYMGTTPDWYADNKASALVQLILIFIPSYFLFQYAKDKYFSADIEKSYRLLIRFSVLLFGVALFVIVGSEIARIVELNLLNGSTYTGIVNRTRIPFGLGLGFTFAFADLFLEIIKLNLPRKQYSAEFIE